MHSAITGVEPVPSKVPVSIAIRIPYVLIADSMAALKPGSSDIFIDACGASRYSFIQFIPDREIRNQVWLVSIPDNEFSPPGGDDTQLQSPSSAIPLPERPFVVLTGTFSIEPASLILAVCPTRNNRKATSNNRSWPNADIHSR
jgi:hypothetical protein